MRSTGLLPQCAKTWDYSSGSVWRFVRGRVHGNEIWKDRARHDCESEPKVGLHGAKRGALDLLPVRAARNIAERETQ